MRLKDYIDARLVDLKAYHDSEADALDKALDQVRQSVNLTQLELQRQVTELHEESSQFIRESAYRERHETLERRLASIERWQSNLIGRGIGLSLVGAIFIAVMAAIITHLLS